MLRFFNSICFMFFMVSVNSYSATNYYKCVTETRTVFSQSPCDDIDTTYKITPSDNTTIPKKNYTKPLNNLERTKIIMTLQRQLRKEHYKLAVLKRHSDGAKYTPPQKTELTPNTALNDDEDAPDLKMAKKVPPTRIEIIEARIDDIEEKIALYQ